MILSAAGKKKKRHNTSKLKRDKIDQYWSILYIISSVQQAPRPGWAHGQKFFQRKDPLHICMYVCIHILKHTCIHTYVSVYVFYGANQAWAGHVTGHVDSKIISDFFKILDICRCYTDFLTSVIILYWRNNHPAGFRGWGQQYFPPWLWGKG